MTDRTQHLRPFLQRCDRAKVEAWIAKLREMPEERHATGTMMGIYPDRPDTPCWCAQGVQMGLVLSLDPVTAAADDLKDVHRSGYFSDAGYAFAMGLGFDGMVYDPSERSHLQVNKLFSHDGGATEEQRNTIGSFYWAIVTYNDDHHWSFVKIADLLQEHLNDVA